MSLSTNIVVLILALVLCGCNKHQDTQSDIVISGGHWAATNNAYPDSIVITNAYTETNSPVIPK